MKVQRISDSGNPGLILMFIALFCPVVLAEATCFSVCSMLMPINETSEEYLASSSTSKNVHTCMAVSPSLLEVLVE